MTLTLANRTLLNQAITHLLATLTSKDVGIAMEQLRARHPELPVLSDPIIQSLTKHYQTTLQQLHTKLTISPDSAPFPNAPCDYPYLTSSLQAYACSLNVSFPQQTTALPQSLDRVQAMCQHLWAHMARA